MPIKKLLNMGDFGANAYIVHNKVSAVLIDAPCYPDKIIKELDGMNLEAVLLTHGHVDHMSAAGKIKEETGCDVYISKGDMPMLTSSELSLADYFSEPFFPCEEAKAFSDGDALDFGGIKFKVIATPGHTVGSVCFVCDAENVIFSGDTLFAGSIGRNFSGTAYKQIIPSIGRLYELGRNYTVLAGHGEETDLYSELIYNPFLGELKDKIK